MPELKKAVEETRELILETAEAHLKRYGYARTTVMEIARACGMSHANVYRFFDSKAAIVDAVIQGWLIKTEQVLQQIVQEPTVASAKLEAFVLGLHRLKRANLTSDKELFETYSAILQSHRPVIEQHIRMLVSMLEGILEKGVQTGEFQISDIHQVKIAVWSATLKFHHPLLVAETIEEPTEEQAKALIKLLLAALRSGVTKI